MATPSRSALITKLQKVLKKHYTATVPDANRSVLEHLLFASCLENASYAAAEEAFAALTHSFFDLNEVRVSTPRELSEVMSSLPDPLAASGRVKRVLQSVFETNYAFDLEDLRKQNLGVAVERLEKIEGITKFTAAYVVQAALGGHAVPIDAGTLGALRVVQLATDAEVAAGAVSGLERAVPKTAGVEFGSQLHQLGADFTTSPYSTALHAILLEIDPTAKERLPNRRAAKRAEQEAQAAKEARKQAAKKTAAAAAAAEKAAKEAEKEKPKAKGKEPAAKTPPAPEPKKKGEAEAKTAEPKKKAEEPRPTAKSAEVRKKDKDKSAREKPAAKKPAEIAKGKPPVKKKPVKGKDGARSASEGLAKRKPR